MKRGLVLVGVMSAVLGWYAPWVTSTRQLAALTYNALDLTEFAKFVVRARLDQITRELFLVPIVAAALALALWASPPDRLARALRYALTLAAAILSLVPLPPYPYLLKAYSSAEDRGSFWLSVAGLVAVAFVFVFGRRIAGRWRNSIFFSVALIGALPSAWELLTHALPAVSNIYGSPAMVSWGFVATTVGFVLVAIGAAVRGD